MNLDDRIKQAARALVERSRCGDQNAMAMLAQCRDTAKRGDGSEQCRRATITVSEAYRYGMAKRSKRPAFSGEPSQDRETLVMARAIQIANAHPVTANGKPIQAIVQEEASKFPEGVQRSAFSLAWMRPLQTWGHLPQEPAQAGRALGIACRLQVVRGGGPLSLISREAEWELT